MSRQYGLPRTKADMLRGFQMLIYYLMEQMYYTDKNPSCVIHDGYDGKTTGGKIQWEKGVYPKHVTWDIALKRLKELPKDKQRYVKWIIAEMEEIENYISKDDIQEHIKDYGFEEVVREF